jgi:phosphoadenosine phosphosulfate reductase
MSSSVLASADELAAAARDLEGAAADAILAWTFGRFQRVAVVASFQAESLVLIEQACRLRGEVDVVTLDTGRLPQETHDLIDAVRQRFPIRLQVVCPDPGEVAEMVGAHGVNLFHASVEARQLCCDVRKARPLRRALTGYEAWVTGLRRQQSSSRAGVAVVARDSDHGGIAKVAPLAAWSREQVWAHLDAHGLPHHALYERGYTSIGCAPCTRATRPGEDERAGRWWWETGAVKECGLHRRPTGAAAPTATPTPTPGAFR